MSKDTKLLHLPKPIRNKVQQSLPWLISLQYSHRTIRPLHKLNNNQSKSKTHLKSRTSLLQVLLANFNLRLSPLLSLLLQLPTQEVRQFLNSAKNLWSRNLPIPSSPCPSKRSKSQKSNNLDRSQQNKSRSSLHRNPMKKQKISSQNPRRKKS